MIAHITEKMDAPARILLSLLFILAGLGKLGSPETTAAYMQSFGLPGALLYPTIAFEIGAGLMLVLGLFTRPVAFLLAGFSVVSGVLFHGNIGDQTQLVMLLKNIAIAGGLLMLTKHGTPSLSIDGVLANRKTATTAQ
jgi:putative oxidoreductase